MTTTLTRPSPAAPPTLPEKLDAPLPLSAPGIRRASPTRTWRCLAACATIASLVTLLPVQSQRLGGPTPRHAEVEIAALDPRAAAVANDTQTCTRAGSWRHTFPAGYLGEVYALVSAGPHTPASARITLSWGRWRWQRIVNAAPGMVHLRTGGTLLLFAKTGGVSGRNPDLTVDSDVPVCVHFGTALDGPVRPIAVVDANPNWTFRSTPYT